MSKQNNAPVKASLWNYVKMLFKMKLPWLYLALVIATSAINIFISSQFAYAMSSVMQLSEDGTLNVGTLVSFALIMVAMTLCTTANLIFTGMATEFINRNLRKLMWKKVMRLPQSFHGADLGETLVSRITTDCDQASAIITDMINIVMGLSGCITYVIQMYTLSVPLSNAVIFMLPLSLVLGYIYGKLRFITGKRNQEKLSDSTAYLIERAKGLSLIKVADTAGLERENGKKCFQDQYNVELQVGGLGVFNVLYNRALSELGRFIPFIFGAALVAAGTLDIPTIMAFYMLSMNTGTSFANMVNYFGNVRSCLGCLSRVIEIIYAPTEDTEQGEAMDVPDQDIRFENVTFGYAGEPILRELNVLIPKDKVTAVIGANGSGKTTLFRLLERLYDPQSGVIYFGDRDVKNYKLGDWRRAFASVSQDCPILEGTIRENITYGCRRKVSQEELEKVAKMANIYELVQSLPEGFDSQVAAGGANFSGGQRQCIAIARAIMGNPDYLLLDEATSNLDAKSAGAVTEAIHNLMAGRTTLIIAHNLNAIRHADNVIVLQDGKIAASGAPDQVIDASEAYRDFVLCQSGRA